MKGALASLLTRVADATLARPVATLAGAGLVLLLLALASTGIRVDGRVDTLLPEHDRGLSLYADEARRLGGAELLFVDVAAGSPAALEDAREVVAARLRDSPLFKSAAGDGDADRRAATGAFLARATPLLLREDDYPDLEARLTPEVVRDRVDVLVDHLLEPGGALRQDALRRDPLGLVDLVLPRIASAMPVEGAAQDRGHLISADGTRSLIVVTARATMGDDDAARAIDAFFEETRAALPPGATLAWTGGHRFYLSNARTLKGDVQRASLLGFVLVLAVVALGFRGRRIVFIAALVVLAGGIGAAAALALVFGEVSALALVFGAALSGITVDYAVHLHAEAREGETRRDAVRRVFGSTAGTVTVGALTSAAAFLVLLASDVPAHRQLGVASAAGIVVSALFALVAGPVLAAWARRDGPSRKNPAPTLLERAAIGWFRFALARPGVAMLGALALVAASVAALPLVRFETDLRRFEAKDAATAADERIVKELWGDVLSQTLLLVRAEHEGAALEAAERVEAALGPFAGGEAGRVSGLSSLLPSPTMQSLRTARWAAFWTDARIAQVRAQLQKAGAEVGLRTDAFAPFLDSLARPPERITAATLAGTLFAPLVERHLVRDADGVRALIVLTGAHEPGSPGTRWPAAVAVAAPGTEILSRKGLADAVVGAARHELTSLALPAIVVIALLLLWYYRSPVRALIGLFPLGGALLATAAALALAGEPLSMMNVPVALPIFGLGVDYAVFLMDSLEGTPAGADGAEEVGRHGAPLLGAWLSTLAGGAALLVAEHPAARTLGAALVLGEGASLLFAWTAIPWLAGRRARSAP